MGKINLQLQNTLLKISSFLKWHIIVRFSISAVFRKHVLNCKLNFYIFCNFLHNISFLGQLYYDLLKTEFEKALFNLHCLFACLSIDFSVLGIV